MSITWARGAAIAASVAWLAAGRDARASDSRAPLDLLRPGSHAAVGLGGDPFLSPLEDQVGWWSHLGLGDPWGSRAVLETSRPADLGGGSVFESRNASCFATTGAQSSRASWAAGVGLGGPSWNGAWEGSHGGLSLRGSGAAADAALRARLLPGLSWQFAGASATQPASHARAAIGAGVRIQHPSGSAVQGSWRRERRADELRSTLYGEPIGVTANLVGESQGVEGRWILRPGAALEGAVARTRWVPFEAATTVPGHHLEPAGTSALNQVGLRGGPAGRRLLVRWTRVALDVEGDLAWGGQRYGGFQYARGTLESWLSAFEVGSQSGRRTLLEFERVRLDARARGEIESWPFTSTLVDLLGQRRIFRLDGTAAWERWHLGHVRPVGGRARGRAGVEWIDLRPQGRVESWQPAFLVFGKVDQQVDALTLRRVQLVVLSLGASLSTSIVDLDAGLEQCVWARTREAARTSPAPDDAAVAGPAGEESRGDTGTHVRFAVSRPF